MSDKVIAALIMLSFSVASCASDDIVLKDSGASSSEDRQHADAVAPDAASCDASFHGAPSPGFLPKIGSS